jgi:ATP-binding cassette subfamily B protein
MPEQTSTNRKVLLGLARRAWEFRGRVSLAVVLLVAAKLAAVAVPLALKRIIDALGNPEAFVTVPVLLLAGYAAVRFANTLFTELRDLVFARVTHSVVADFTRRTFAHLHALPAKFHIHRATGSLIRDVERGTSGIGFLLGMAFFTIVPTLVEIGAVMAIMVATYPPRFAVTLLVTFFAYVLFTVVFTRRRAIHQRRLNELDSSANRRLVDSLLNYETVKVYANEAYEAKRFQDVMSQWTEAGVRNQKALTRLHVGQSAIIGLGVAAVMILAGQGVVGGTMTVGDLVLINAYVIQVCLPLNSLGFVFREASDALVKAERLFELLGEKAEVDAESPLPAFRPQAGEVRFERVSFAYEAGRPVLQEVDFRIAPATAVAVVGGSGSGKSTLARLLLRFYEPASGRVTIDGIDVRDVSPQDLRRAIGIVPQDTTLFNDTIEHNIAYGRIGATREEVAAAAKAANVHAFIEALPQGYDTEVGERGLKLSGGEKQRIAIARAILKNPPILVFDEATSALDTRSERAIQDELDRLSKSRTTLMIAHRLSTVVGADEIIVLEHGRIAERGRHEELLERGGLYAQMWNLQQQERALARAERRAALQPVDLSALVAAAVHALRPEIEARGIHLYMTLGGDVTRVTGDLPALQQLVWDLAARAVQGTPDGGRLEIRLDRDGPEARLAIADPRAPPFALASSEGQALASGEPLPGTQRRFDVAELRRLVERHEGRLTLQAAAPNGTTYVVALPLRAIDTGGGMPAATEATGAEGTLAGREILVVDDHEDAREVVALLLEARGAHVVAAGKAAEVLSRLRGLPHDRWPDLLVCDISLPDDDGYSVLRQVRVMEAERDVALDCRIPAIALTGHAEAADRTRALLAGFQLHVAKPVDPDALIASIARLLGASRVRDSRKASPR